MTGTPELVGPTAEGMKTSSGYCMSPNDCVERVASAVGMPWTIVIRFGPLLDDSSTCAGALTACSCFLAFFETRSLLKIGMNERDDPGTSSADFPVMNDLALERVRRHSPG